MRAISTIITIVIFLANSLSAQECGSDIINNKNKNSSKSYRLALEKSQEKWIESKAQKSEIIDHHLRTSYEIPIVIHVMHNGEALGHPNNPTDKELYDYVEYVNKVFAARWKNYDDTTEGGVFIPMKFVLAKRTPGCSPVATNGITRTNLGAIDPVYLSDGVSIDPNEPGISDDELKSYIHWPSEEYYNIYLVRTIKGAGGYAYYPLYFSFLDGAVLRTLYSQPLQSINDYYVAFPHEIGHSWALPHTFEGEYDGICPDDFDCNYDGDGICDTEPHLLLSNAECATGINECTGNLYDGVEFNIMNYTACPKRFTPLQKDKIIYTLLNHRAGLLNSLGATALDGSIQLTAASCTPSTNNTNPNEDIGSYNIQVNTQTISTLGYLFESNQDYKNYSCNQKPFRINLNGTNFLNVSTFNQPQQVKVYIDYNNNGIFESSELVMYNNGSNDQQYDFNQHGIQFTVPNGAETCKYLRMRVITDLASNPEVFPCNNVEDGQTEDFAVIISNNPINPILTIATTNDIYCIQNSATFEATITEASAINYEWKLNGSVVLSGATATSYTINNPAFNDELICFVSYINECGETKITQSNIVHSASYTLNATVSENGNKLLAGPSGSLFTWINCNTNEQILTTNSTSFTPPQNGSYKVIAKKEGCVDTSSCIAYNKIGMDETALNFQIYPNPSNGLFAIQLQQSYFSDTKISITDITGKIIYQKQVNEQNQSIELNVASGVYFVTIKDNISSATQKIIIH